MCFNRCQTHSLLLGDSSPDARLEFWTHLKTLPHYQHHARLHGMTADELRASIPVSLHCDGAEMFSNEEYFVWSWSSAFAVLTANHDILYQRYPIAIVPLRDMLDEHVRSCFRIFCCHQVFQRVNSLIAQVTAWSLDHAAAGTFPAHGFRGEKFASRSFRAGLVGCSEFAGGYRTLCALRVLVGLNRGCST